jgi:hypothetical protein
VTQRFIADVRPFIDSMSQLIASAELAEAAVQALIDKIAQLDGKVVTIAVNTVGNAGDSGVGGIATQAEAATSAVRDLAVAWTQEAADQDAARAGAEAFGREISAVAADFEAFMNDRLHASMQNLEQDLFIQAHSADEADVAFERLRQGYQEVYAGIDPITRATDSYREALQALNVEELRNWEVSGGVISANRIVGRTVTDTAAAANNASNGWAIQIGWLRLTAAALHWIVAGSAEFLAVAVPAAVALGAGLAVAAQGAQNAYQHFSALYAATESTYSAMHQTVGTVLGLGDALQKAQNQANPGVYEILGSALNDAKQGFSSLANVGLQVVHMFDEFAARITVDLKQGMGQQIQGLLAGMLTDLRQFGEIFGNLGHALLNFASAMPGLAHALLGVAEGLSSVIEWASRTGPLLTFAMGMEELFRWGGLALSVLARLTGQFGLLNSIAGSGGFIIRFGAAFLALASGAAQALTSVGSFVAGLGAEEGVLTRLGGALQTAGAETAAFAEAASPAMVAGVTAGIAAIAGLVLMLSRVKNSTQQWIASTNQAISSASDLQVVGKIGAAFAAASTKMAQQEAILHSYSWSVQTTGGVLGNMVVGLQKLPGPLGNAAQGLFNLGTQTGFLGDVTRAVLDVSGGIPGVASTLLKWIGPSEQAASNISRLRIEEASLVGTTSTFSHNLSFLGGQFHTTAVGALALAGAAGVNLTQGLLRGTQQGAIAVQMINNLKAGLGAMQAPASEIGADMNAVGIQSQLAASKVGTVNQAMDAFVAGTTGGMNTIMQFNAGLHAMGNDTVSSSQTIAGAIDTISKTAAKMGYTLQGIGPHAQQSWQQFDAAVQQGNSVLDTFRTGMAEGVVTQAQYTREIQAVGGALLPFAAHNRTALAIVSQLAQEMGDPATHNLRTLASQFGITGKAAQNMATAGMGRAIANMANLNTVARNLSVTVGTQLDSAMAKAIVGASGLSQAYTKWANDLRNNAGPQQLQNDLNGISKAQDFVTTAEAKATPVMNSNTAAMGAYGSALKGAGSDASNFSGKLQDTHAALSDVVARAGEAANATQGLSSQTRTAAASASGLTSNTSQATAKVQALGSASNATRGSLGTVNNEIRTTSSAAGSAQGPLNSMSGAIRTVGASAMTAAGEVRGLQSAMAALQSKTVTLTTNMVTVTSTVHRQHGGPVFPGVPYTVGEAGEELFVPSQAGVILPHDQTAQLIGAPQAAAGPPAGGFGNQGASEVHSHISVNLDGRQLWKGIQTQMLQWQIRNSGRATGLTVPQPPGKLT